MTYFALIFSDIGETIRQALRTFAGRIAAILYNFIVDEYNVFMYIARAEILDDKYIQSIYNKVGLILGMFMVFKLTFSLIQSLVNPDTFTDQKKGFASIIQRSIISIVLLGITPSLFNMAFDFQRLIVGVDNSNNNVIYKLIVGNTVSEDAESFGHVLSADLFFSFYREREEGIFNQGTTYDEQTPKLTVLDFKEFKRQIKSGGDFNETVKYLTLRQGGEYIIEWNELFSIGVALVVIWLLVIYCIQVAARVVQLAYLQLIAPVPILSYISDPDGAFKKWTQQCLTTYLDLFIRLAIIYFIIVLAGQILSAYEDSGSVIMTSTGLDKDSSTLTWVKIFLVLGLLMFGKKVPELLKDLFPNIGGGVASLGFGLKSPKNLFNDIPIVGGAANKALGYAKNLGKKAGKFTWSHTGGAAGKFVWGHTGGKIKNNYSRWKDDRAGYKEGYKKDKESEDAWKEYGNAFNVDPSASPEEKLAAYKKAFHSSRDKKGEYAASYAELEIASNALKNYKGDTNSADYRKLLADKEKAQKNHDVNREKYKDLARREDQLKRYANRHPEVKKKTSSTSTSSSSSTSAPPQNIPQTQNTQQQSQIPGRPEQYDERIEYATNKYNELVDNGASDDELQQQLETLRNLNDGKEQAEKFYREIDNNIDEANERNNDGYGGQ